MCLSIFAGGSSMELGQCHDCPITNDAKLSAQSWHNPWCVLTTLITKALCLLLPIMNLGVNDIQTNGFFFISVVCSWHPFAGASFPSWDQHSYIAFRTWISNIVSLRITESGYFYIFEHVGQIRFCKAECRLWWHIYKIAQKYLGY